MLKRAGKDCARMDCVRYLSRAIICVGMLGSLGMAQDENLDEPLHYITTYREQIIGVGQVVRYSQKDNRHSPIRFEYKESSRLHARGVTSSTTTIRTEILDSEGFAIRSKIERHEAGRKYLTSIDVSDTEVRFDTTLGKTRRRFVAPITEPVRFGLDGYAFYNAGKLSSGASIRASVIARNEFGIALVEAKITDTTDLSEISPLYEKGETGYVIRVSNVGDDNPWEIIADSRGRTVRIKTGALKVLRVTRAAARLPKHTPQIANRISTERVENPNELISMTVELEIENPVERELFVSSMYGECEQIEKGVYRIETSANLPNGIEKRAELSEKLRRLYLAPGPLVESTSRRILIEATRALGGDVTAVNRRVDRYIENGALGLTPEFPRADSIYASPLLKTFLLARWVYRRLAKNSYGPATASALETLTSSSGDCTEHVALFTALSRAHGLPTRQVMGLVHDGEGFEFHAWAEVYIDSRWVAIDPTLGHVGVGGNYILLGREGPASGYRRIASAIQGRTVAHVLDVKTR